jgi:hypothetical protein
MSVDLLPGMPRPKAPALRQMTEREMLDLLHERFGAVDGNGGIPKPRYVKAEHVRARAGLFQRNDPTARTADFAAVDTYPSSKCAIHGVEVKVSRSDWLRELKDPGKSAACMAWCSHWWLAVPDKAIVADGELPPGWGLLAATERDGVLCLRAAVKAPRRAVPPIPPESLASLLYAVAKTAAARGTT